jgi:hypothetical protein
MIPLIKDVGKGLMFSLLVTLQPITAANFTDALDKAKKEQEIVDSLVISIYLSRIDKTIAENLVVEARKRALAQNVDEKNIFAGIFSKLNDQISHYQNLIDNPKDGYVLSAKWLGGACLLAAIAYWSHRLIGKDEEVSNQIYALGAHSVFASGGHASARIYRPCPLEKEKKISSLLTYLAYLEDNQFSFIFETVIFSSAAAFLGILSLDNIEKTLCAKTYHTKYCELKNELERMLTLTEQ